ncbi:hypothetical protein SmJEL517_g02592 [Synchytrium microbalum]|uniref:protein-L-isoaspartate(D-aspartate) O-methyltransferase n=1 Tax=Synchytrium microbalum TaxID=1806994 RepID=A0A507CAB4_9FUNG|nr:uncharacterized protein SmJEL517_g02592 [Synchytrium microbalum]TPX34924.1 hypothetical protein SmJEL517_g02592 [Synchytrium microbalum]
MAWRCSGKSNLELITNMRDNELIKQERVFNAMTKIDRAKYCPAFPYEDSPQVIGYGATISAPHMHAHALELLLDKLTPGSKVLDVGSGSGYLTSCFAELVGPSGKVVGIDHIDELVEMSQRNIMSDHPEYLEDGRIVLVAGDGRQGYVNESPYDAMHVGAAADGVPQALFDQLKVGGRLIVPVGAMNGHQVLTQFDKKEDGKIEEHELMNVIYVPLTTAKFQRLRSR